MTAQALAEPIPFGASYRLLELLAVGGMAEIYRARQAAMAGFEKDIVIKRLKPELAAKPAMVQMFLDEARISAVLNHPNIVHVYDVGEHDGVPYIAMELIHGEEMNQLCRRGLGLGKFLPLAHAVELIRQAAIGMGYFHARRDGHGEGFDIIHCDISPTNLLVTQEGGIKIIDFGIARARHQRYRDHGAVPGKVSYMSPEQVAREPLDHRSDIFALGVVLYEITVGKRLFKGPAAEVVKRVEACEIQPPTFARRDYPGHLESIVMRALEKHPEDRFQSAYDLADELDDFLREAQLKSGPMRIARYLDELTAAAGGERRQELIAEAERRADEAADELDFDRGMFDSFQAQLGGTEADASEWDEYEESDARVADALGVDPGQLDKSGVKPVDVESVAIGSGPVAVAPAPAPAPAPKVESAPVVVEAPKPDAEEVEEVRRSEAVASTSTSTSTSTSAVAMMWVVLVWAVIATGVAVVALVR